jgi:SET domain-containing protein
VQYTVESSSLTFINHGCNGNTNVGGIIPYIEATWDPRTVPDNYDDYNDDRSVYDPLTERRYGVNAVTTVTDRDILAGEEIVCNYIFFARRSQFAEKVTELRDACRGAPGYVEQLQNEHIRPSS